MASVEQNKKKEDLENYLKELGSVAVAFSGGVDSTFLLKAAHDTLGKECIFNCNKRFKNLWLQFFLSQNQGFMRLFEKTVLK